MNATAVPTDFARPYRCEVCGEPISGGKFCAAHRLRFVFVIATGIGLAVDADNEVLVFGDYRTAEREANKLRAAHGVWHSVTEVPLVNVRTSEGA